MAIQTFTAGQVLTAAQQNALQANDYNWTVSNKTASYTLVAADKGTRIVMSNASATTITVNTGLFNAGDTLFIQNIGAGTCTITAGTATVTTASSLALAQWGGGTLYFTSASAAIFFSGGGAVYGAATGGTGVTNVTISGVNYAYTSFTSTGTLTNTKPGLFDVLVFSGGGGGNSGVAARGGGGGGSGGVFQATMYIDANLTVTIGAGGVGGTTTPTLASFGSSSAIGSTARSASVAGGGFGGGLDPTNFTGNNQYASAGGSGGGGGGQGGVNAAGLSMASGISGNNGGIGVSQTAGGGGGGATAVGSAASGTTGGAGGAGYDVSAFIGGSALFKAGGGGGGGTGTGGAGGSSVGGTGGSNGAGTSAAANTAGGGGGGANAANAGAGGSGIVYIRWKV